MAVFEKRGLLKQSFLQKIFRLKIKANYVIEMENLLCDGEKDILSIKEADAEALRVKYKIKDGDFDWSIKALFDMYFNFCLNDKQLSNNEKAQLEHLRALLKLDKSFVDGRIAERGEWIYRDNVSSVIADGKVTDEEKKTLEDVRGQFNLSEDESRSIYNEECAKKLQVLADRFSANRRVSPDEEKEFRDMAVSLDVELNYSVNDMQYLRHLWDIENAPLPPLESPINLQRSETLYYRTNIDWYETRTRTTYVSYGGITTSFRIMKGVTLRSGMIAPTRHSEEYMKLIDSGELFLTSKRIVFIGTSGNKNIPWTKVLSITAYEDGIEIGKDTGKKPFFKCNNVEEIGLFITRLMKGC